MLVALLPACNGFDDDEAFRPRWKESFLLFERADGSLGLALANEGGLDTGFGARYAQPILDLDSRWLLASSPAQLHELTGSLQRSLPGPAQGLVAGIDAVLLLDSLLPNRVYTAAPRDFDVQQLDVAAGFSRGYYVPGTYYLYDVGGDSVAAMDERAYTARAGFSFSDSIMYVQQGASNILEVQTTSGGAVRRHFIDVNSQLVTNPGGTAYEGSALRLSPYTRQRFATELLANVAIVNDTLALRGSSGFEALPVRGDSATSLEVDFLLGRVYYTHRDSLFVLEVATGTQLGAWPFEGRLRKAYHTYTNDPRTGRPE